MADTFALMAAPHLLQELQSGSAVLEAPGVVPTADSDFVGWRNRDADTQGLGGWLKLCNNIVRRIEKALLAQGPFFVGGFDCGVFHVKLLPFQHCQLTRHALQESTCVCRIPARPERSVRA